MTKMGAAFSTPDLHGGCTLLIPGACKDGAELRRAVKSKMKFKNAIKTLKVESNKNAIQM
jgi:hypothetical protein